MFKVTSSITTLALLQYNPLYLAQSMAFSLLSNIPKKTLEILVFQMSALVKNVQFHSIDN